MGLSSEGLATLKDLASHFGDAGLDASALASVVTERRCPKGDIFLCAGEQARTAGIVVNGIQGEFYELPDGKRKAKWLAGPGDVFGSMEDLVRQGPARATIQALTDGQILCVPYATLREMALSDPPWSRFFVVMMEELYRRKSEREYALLMLKAEDRYQWFLERHGQIEARLSQEIIASYLGITPVHLSRVRNATRKSRKR